CEGVTDLARRSHEHADERIAGEIFNAGYENQPVAASAERVRRTVGEEQVTIETTPTNDHRSYPISSEKIKRRLGFEPRHTVEGASADLTRAFRAGAIPNPMDDPRYYNIKTMLGTRL